MAKITINSKQWSDIVLTYLLDSINRDDVLDNASEEYQEFIRTSGLKIRSMLVRHYLDMDLEIRVKYRLIKDAFSEKGEKSIVEIK